MTIIHGPPHIVSKAHHHPSIGYPFIPTQIRGDRPLELLHTSFHMLQRNSAYRLAIYFLTQKGRWVGSYRKHRPEDRRICRILTCIAAIATSTAENRDIAANTYLILSCCSLRVRIEACFKRMN